jgi:hypothetical protein
MESMKILLKPIKPRDPNHMINQKAPVFTDKKKEQEKQACRGKFKYTENMKYK